MSRYDWPTYRPRGERHDDPAGRAAWSARRGLGTSLEEALRASRATPELPRAPGGVMRAPVTGREYVWQPLGPVTLLGGQAEGRPRVSGRVNMLAVHPAGERVYAASANGGVWYSSDGGARWRSIGGLAATNTAGIMRPAQRNACGAIYVDWGATEGDDTVFVGTGEVMSSYDGAPGSAEAGIGILVGAHPANSALPDPWVREAPELVNTGVYRIARQPGGGPVTAATRAGLWERPATGGADVSWARPAGAPFNTLDGACTDLLWTAADGATPARMWVWVSGGPSSGLWVRDADATDFAQVAVDGAADYAFTTRRAALAATTPAPCVWLFNDRGDGDPFNAGLFRVTNPPRPAPPATAPPVAHSVIGVPNVLREQGFYDIAIAADPSTPDRVVLGGSWLDLPTRDGALGQYNASIVVGDVAADAGNAGKLTFGHPAAWTHVGVGVHPDVHDLVYSNAGARLWTGCDGGVFRSDHPNNAAGFYPRNEGLSVCESNFLAGHPVCEGNIVVGLQDNGTVERLSTGVWRMAYMGDGGGVVMNPRNPSQYLAQYVAGTWRNHNSPGTGPLVRGGAINATERDAAAFYSMPASIAAERAPGPPLAVVPISQLLVGTCRPWYSDDFGVTWVTLPSGTDPLPADPSAQDDLGDRLTICRWQSPDVAWVLQNQGITRLERVPGSHNGGGPGSWSAAVESISRPAAVARKKRPPAVVPSLLDSPVWTDLLPDLDPGTPPVQRGARGALYVGTVGHDTRTDVDTLWWFDGTSNWHPTGLRAAVPAAVTALARDPNTPDDVWVGTTVGVWHGRRSFPAPDSPQWDWTEQRVNGLPEATVEDLQIFRDGDLVLLRAAIAARGIWELRLDASTVEDLNYVRAHDDDLRHRVGGPPAAPLRATEVARDLSTPRSWHGSPDVRLHETPFPIAAPGSLPWTRGHVANAAALRRFQAALRSSTGDPRIVANGVWDAYFSEVLRDHGAPTVHIAAVPPAPAFDRVRLTRNFWRAHMKGAHARAEPWGTGDPTEADLHEHYSQLPEGDAGRVSCSMRRRAWTVNVVVHHRGPEPVDGANVRVTLLRWTMKRTATAARWDDATTWPSTDVPWVDAVNEVLNSADGLTALPVGADWAFVAGTDTTSRRTTLAGQTLDAMTSGVATFRLPTALMVPGANNVMLLVAVIHTATNPAHDIALTAMPLKDLVLTSASVAARSVRVL